MKKITWMMLVGAVMMGSLSGGAEAWWSERDRQEEGESHSAYNKRMVRKDMQQNGGLLGMLLGFGV